jgi:hypothetical protein
MLSHLVDLAYPQRRRNTVAGALRLALPVLTLTAAVILGPLIAVAYHSTQASDAAMGSFSLAQAVRGLLCPLMLLSLYFSRGLHLLTHRLVRPLLFLAAYAVLTSSLGPYPYQNIVSAVKVVFITLVFLNALHLAAQGRVRERWLTACAWAVLVVMAACIGAGLSTGRTVAAYNTRYATAGLMNHVSIASFFVLSTLAVFLKGAAVGRAAVAGVGIVCVLLFFTMCRSALIAAALGTVCSLLMGMTRLGGRVSWCKALVPIGLILLLTSIALNTAPGTDLTARFKDLNPQEGSGSGRYIFWKISLEHILHRPLRAQLWGDGMGSIRNVLKERFGLAIGCHDDWLDFAAAFGLCGWIGMGWWHYELVRLVWSFRGRPEGLFQGVCAAVIILVLNSLGTGGSLDPAWALTYAGLGFWVGHMVRAKPPRGIDPFSYGC